MAKKTVVIGLVGTTLDIGSKAERWARWRPSVSLCQHADFPVDRFELLAATRSANIAAQVAADITQVSPHTEVCPHTIDFDDPWDFSEVYERLADFADAYRWHPEREDYFLHITTGTHVAQICLFLLCETRAMPGRLLQSSPGPKGAGSPSGRIDVIDLELAKYDRLAARFRARQHQGASLLKAGIETRNAAFNQLIDELERVASRSRDPILLTGETGTGKTALCRRIFELKRARQHLAGDFVAVNCATLRGDTAMSALFGHARGAFTGASEPRAGFLRKADGGLLFLDEIGELGRDEQAMLLKALEDRRFYPVGADKEVASAFQLVAGTNRDLAAAVRAGAFREDLLARLATWTFRLPALRERREDLAPNLDYELERVGADVGHRASMSKPARDRFLRFALGEAAWRANFRDFGAAIRRMVTLSDGGRIAEPDVELELARLRATWSGAATGGDVLGEVLGAERAAALDRFDRVQLADVVAVCRASPSLSAAGRVLFAASRQDKRSHNDADRLRKYLARFGLSFDAITAP
ncbi:MAG TPA: RNA repair transcriptional activator RtcR [Kofleriaceae bacterium]|nr:RNA repair transcriptional activator RtcR [Kofleriaceae bacterium]